MGLKRVGALWGKKDKNKKEYLSGTIDLGGLGEMKIMVFKNEKEEENHPDWVIQLIEDEKEDN
jgi:uncharacterized protein (DUF736 family)